MRNVLIARDTVAEDAGTRILAAGGNAADAVVCAMLAGATRASPAALLGSGVVVIAGAGVGAYAVDGRARVPGLGERRGSVPEDPPVSWRAAVPGILEGALVAHGRFGTATLGLVTRTAASAVRDAESGTQVRARVKLLEALPRTGINALERLGILQSIFEVAGLAAGGVFTRDDLAAAPPPVRPLVEVPAEEHEVLIAPDDPPLLRHTPPPAPAVPVDVAICADMHGVIAAAVWAVPPEAIALPGDTGLSLAALSNPHTKGVTRRRPGSVLELPVPVAIVRHRGRAWAGAAVGGTGDVVAARDAYLRTRLGAVGIDYGAAGAGPASVTGLALWLVRDDGDEVRKLSEGFNV